MWWHGNLEEINEDGFSGVDDESFITESNDLYAHLGRPRVFVRDSHEASGAPVAEVTFSSSFEEEHGIGVLVDGVSVIGIGYASSARPFRGG